jgi:sugar lactone lactonase YvrE
MVNIQNCIFLTFLSAVILSGCYKVRGHYGGKKTYDAIERKISTHDIAIPEGYKVEAVGQGLTFPTGITFDENGDVYIVESGYSYGELWLAPRLLKLEDNGSITEIVKGSKNGPWTGVDYKNGNFYVAEGGSMEGGKILKISKDGKSIVPLVENLPSLGDHQTNGPIVGKDGYVYFGQGTVTNSGVVGKDNADFGWLYRHAELHDIPCEDIILNGQNFKSENPLTEDKKDKVNTGAYSTFGTTTYPHQTIKGSVPCNGAIMRVPANGGPVELVAWGLRNPFGLSFSPNGSLFATENGYDTRGSRPGYGTADVLWEIKPGSWYGWPDYSAGQPLATKDYKTPHKDPQFLLEIHPQTPPKPSAILDVHSSANGMDFSRNDNFGYKGEAFIALFGDMAPNVGRIYGPVGFKVIRVDVLTGIINEFAVNKGKTNNPASEMNLGGLERPIAVKFDPTGDHLYVVDFGIMPITKEGPAPKKETGMIWKISRSEIVKAEK